ncbi:hypothetical protein SAMN06265348_101542 [Pedobacter westerhofensis]|uniref:Uncharacterized protein n=1 Tax=Pedobacter westerhofensis TaxID=425512 RepID=A0A521AYC9_9SPHI|nr:hypothetical protein SAMN06265348_101542 [Pedobacter westerhofensis]
MKILNIKINEQSNFLFIAWDCHNLLWLLKFHQNEKTRSYNVETGFYSGGPNWRLSNHFLSDLRLIAALSI